jgi:hypothetical protein
VTFVPSLIVITAGSSWHTGKSFTFGNLAGPAHSPMEAVAIKAIKATISLTSRWFMSLRMRPLETTCKAQKRLSDTVEAGFPACRYNFRQVPRVS